jgi:peptidoglycan hydrolase CwlO-like protein
MGSRLSLDRCTEGKWFDTDLHTLDRKLQAMEQQLHVVEQRVGGLEETLQHVQKKYLAVESLAQKQQQDIHTLSERCLLLEKQIEPRMYLEDNILILEDS